MRSIVLRCLIVGCVVTVLRAEEVTEAPLPPLEAARTFQVPPGFNVTLFAGEPDVKQPIVFCLDDRGRIWVAEAYNYPNHGTGSGDRIIIVEDSDGDGQHDKRTVFYDGLNYVTGIEVGFGGVWVMSPPYFYFIADRDGDDRPDGKPEVVLDGFGNHANAHNLANGFAWGPDGWLYGTHGRTNWSMIGKPGTPNADRVRFDGGVYRYHPVRHVWEPYADGTTNPWGIDWNDFGHSFVCNCVNPHLFQVIQGAHYEPWRGRKSSQHAYQRIDTIADHLHFTGLSNVRSGLDSSEEDAAGGGHAHCGTMIYLGDNFPEKYRNTLFTNNIHGRRINNDILRRNGSGYVASHGADLLRSKDPWFMGVTLAYGPAGEVYVSDWSDTGECHSVVNTRKHTGRIYRITYGETRHARVDLKSLSNSELVELQLHKNDWYVRHARRLLHERAAAGADMSAPNRRLREIFTYDTSIPRKLRAMWALRVTGGADEEFLVNALSHDNDDIRSWAVTLLCEDREPSANTMRRFVEMASSGSSSLVRLSLASALQRFEFSDRWELATALASRSDDRTDPNLPLMIWYGCESLVNADLQRFANLAATASIPRVRINAARRIASSTRAAEGLELLAQHLAKTTHGDIVSDLLTGILEGVEGRRRLPMPTSWHEAFDRLMERNDATIQDQAIRLAIVFNDQIALQRLQKIANDETHSAADRSRAIDALVGQRVAGLDADLIRLIKDASVRPSVLRGLAAYDSPQTATAILTEYDAMSDGDQQVAQLTLASRESWAMALLNSIEAKLIAPSDLTAYTARQIRALGNETLNTTLAAQWGNVRETPRDKSKQIASIKKWLSPETIASADLARGEQLFKKQCATCHQLFGEGGKIGPDITGSQRTNLDYMLENIIDPNATLAKDYQMEILETQDGRVITGLIESEDEQTIAVQTVNERLVFPAADIANRKSSDVSIMPQGLLEPLSENEIRDLMAYLQRKS
ncbi:MAG: c-type cytochrome [Planctomycetales bacterium]|nr:c-type cytochrome [Planctomycetales bacterium]